MNRARIILLLLLLSALRTAFAADVVVTIAKFTSTAIAGRKCLVTPISVDFAGAGLAANDKTPYITDTNGTFTIPGAAPGDYSLEITAPPASKIIYFHVLDTNSTLNITNLVIPSPDGTGPTVGSPFMLKSGGTAASPSFTGNVILPPGNIGDVWTQSDANGSGSFQPSASGPGGGEVNVGANLGTGLGLYWSKSGAALQFKSIATSGGATVSTNTTTLTIAADAPGAAASVQGVVNTHSNEWINGSNNITGWLAGSNAVYLASLAGKVAASGGSGTGNTFSNTTVRGSVNVVALNGDGLGGSMSVDQIAVNTIVGNSGTEIIFGDALRFDFDIAGLEDENGDVIVDGDGFFPHLNIGQWNLRTNTSDNSLYLTNATSGARAVTFQANGNLVASNYVGSGGGLTWMPYAPALSTDTNIVMFRNDGSVYPYSLHDFAALFLGGGITQPNYQAGIESGTNNFNGKLVSITNSSAQSGATFTAPTSTTDGVELALIASRSGASGQIALIKADAFKMSSAVASTDAGFDALKKLVSQPTGLGVKTNDNANHVGYSQFPTLAGFNIGQWYVRTNNNGSLQLSNILYGVVGPTFGTNGSIILPPGFPPNTNAAASITNVAQFFHDNTIGIGSMAGTGTNLFGVATDSNSVTVTVDTGLVLVPTGPYSASLRATGGGGSVVALAPTNAVPTTTNIFLIDPTKSRTWNICLQTNFWLRWTNISDLTNYPDTLTVNWHEATNGTWHLLGMDVAGGFLIKTNIGQYFNITTNAGAEDKMFASLDWAGTNLCINWRTNIGQQTPSTNTANGAGGGGGGGSPIIAGSQVYLKDDNNTGSTSSDASGNGFNATLSGTTPPAWSSPYIGVASLFFDGATSYMPTSSSASFSPDSNDATLTVWIKTTFKQLGTVWGMVNNSSGRYFIINFTSNGFIDGAAQGGGGPAGISANGQDYSDGGWHFVVAEYDHTAGTVSLWVDNVSIGTSGATGTPLSIGTVPMTAGQFGTIGGSFYKGYVDEHVLYPFLVNGTDRTSLFNQTHP